MPKLPEFKNDDDAAAWFDGHDSAVYMEGMKEADKTFEVTRTSFATRPMDVRLRSDHLEAIQTVAERKGMPYQTLVQSWLLEKLIQEAPDLLAK